MRTSARVVGGVTALVALACLAPPRPGPATAGAATAAGSSRLNVVLILTDDQTMESVARMPYVSSRTDWITFPSAFVNNSLCCPSRATILTGQWDTHSGVTNNSQGALLDESETLPVWLQRAGYRTGLFGKYLNAYPFDRGDYVPAGWDDWQASYGPSMYRQYDWDLNSNGTPVHYGSTLGTDYGVNVLARKVTDFVAASAATGTPFFAYFAPTATHSPWRANKRWSGRFRAQAVAQSPNANEADVTDKPLWVQSRPLLDPAGADAHRRSAWAAAGSVDDAVTRIDDALRTAGVFDTTVEIFMTDNGYSFGSHRWPTKRCEYDECIRTPMLVRYPGQAGRTDQHLITNTDIAGTISEIAAAPPGRQQDGHSFAPLLRGEPVASWPEDVLLHWPGGNGDGLAGRPDSLPQFWGIRSAAAKYVELDTGERELYDLAADPYELANRAGDPAYALVQQDLQARLTALKKQAGAAALPRRADQPTVGPLGPDLD